MSSNVYRSEVWKIENFSKSPDMGRVSPTFTLLPGFELYLELVFESLWTRGKKMQVAVVCNGIPENVDLIHGRITCSNSEGRKFHFDEDSFRLEPGFMDCTQTVINRKGVRLPSEIDQVFCLPDDVFIMEVSLAISGQNLDSFDRESKVEIWKELAADLGEMYRSRSKSQADVKFTFVGGGVLTAHRLILSARSPVFRRMFESDMLERNSDAVPIEDCNAVVFGLFLTFLYSGELADDVGFESLQSLYSAANKYGVASLRKMCSRRMCSAITVDNVSLILHLATLHGDSEAKQVAKDFIQKNPI